MWIRRSEWRSLREKLSELEQKVDSLSYQQRRKVWNKKELAAQQNHYSQVPPNYLISGTDISYSTIVDRILEHLGIELDYDVGKAPEVRFVNRTQTDR